jgi:hypothetical protein
MMMVVLVVMAVMMVMVPMFVMFMLLFATASHGISEKTVLFFSARVSNRLKKIESFFFGSLERSDSDLKWNFHLAAECSVGIVTGDFCFDNSCHVGSGATT